MFTFLRNLAFLAIVATVGAASASANIPVEVYSFTGVCTNCSGTGTATLILLANYQLGTQLSASDLYSFNYQSSTIPDLSIFNDPTETLSGILPVGLGPANISISGINGSFSSSLNGQWMADPGPPDVGTMGVWTAGYPTPTPEPSTLSILAVGLLGMILFARRPGRRASSV